MPIPSLTGRNLYLAMFIILWAGSGCNAGKDKDYTPADAQKLRLLNKQWYAQRYNNPDSAFYTLRSARAIEASYDSKTGDINYFSGMTFLLCNMYARPDSGKIYLDSALHLMESGALTTAILQSKANSIKGIYYKSIQEYDSARNSYLQALRLAPQPVDSDYVINSIYAPLSFIAFHQQNYEQAYRYFEPLLKQALLYKNPPKDIAALINGFSICINIKGPLREQRQMYLFAARKLADSLHITGLNGTIYTNLSTYYFDKGMNDSGMFYSRRAIDQIRRNQIASERLEIPYLLIIPKQIEAGDFAGAKTTLNEMLKVTDTARFFEQDLANYYLYSYQINKQLGDDKAALRDIEHYKDLQGKLMAALQNQQLTEYEKQMKRLNNTHILQAKNYEIKTQRNYLILAIIIIVLVLTGSTYLYFYRRKKQLLEKKYWAQMQKERDTEHQNKLYEERNRISSEMHDDLGTTLTSTIMAVELVENFPDDKAHLSNIRVSAGQMHQKINEIIWNLNMQNDNIGSLNDYVIRFARNFLAQANIELDWDEDVEDERHIVPGYVRRVIYLSFKELINNITKHARATKVTVRLYSRQSVYRLTIQDNGIGIDWGKTSGTPVNGRGYGLGNIRKNISGLNGRVEWVKPKEGGTQVSIEIDLAGTV